MNLLLLDTLVQSRRRFIGGVTDIVGRSNVRSFYVPSPTEGAVVPDEVVAGRNWTHANTPAGRITRQGNGFVLASNGSSDALVTPDANDLSFGNGTVDSPFTIVVMHLNPDLATAQQLFGKINVTAEYNLLTNGAAKPRLLIQDTSVPVNVTRIADAVITANAFHVLGSTYSAAIGGATAGNDVAIYVDGVAVASTAANQATYVAMENLTHDVTIGSTTTKGLLGPALLVAGALSATQMLAVHQAFARLYGI